MEPRKEGMGRLLAMIVAAGLVAAGPAVGADESGSEPDSRDQRTQSGDAGSEIGFLGFQGEEDWLASALIGRSVHDSRDKAVGDINDVLLKDGRIKAVLIGIGGFLDLGQKEVAVPVSVLEFRKKEESSAYQRSRELPDSLRRKQQESGDRQASGRAGAPAREETGERKDHRHSDMYIVLNVTEEQLEAAPSFARLGQPAEEDSGRSAPQDDESAAD